MLKCKNIIIITNSSTTPWDIDTISFCTFGTNLQKKFKISPMTIYYSQSYMPKVVFICGLTLVNPKQFYKGCKTRWTKRYQRVWRWFWGFTSKKYWCVRVKNLYSWRICLKLYLSSIYPHKQTHHLHVQANKTILYAHMPEYFLISIV